MLRTDLPIHGIDSPDVIGVGNEQGRFLRRGATETLADSMKGGFGPDIYLQSEKEGLPLQGISINALEISGGQIIHYERELKSALLMLIMARRNPLSAFELNSVVSLSSSRAIRDLMKISSAICKIRTS
jgi:hypothetical protein